MKQQILELIDNMIGTKELSTFDYYGNGRIDGLQELRSEIEKMDEWIPVTERLPEYDGYFLGANCYTRFSGEVAWDKEKFEFRKGKYKQHITHWQEIPESPLFNIMPNWQSVARAMGSSESYIKELCIFYKQKYLPHNPSSHD